jgi:hypothetical protein
VDVRHTRIRFEHLQLNGVPVDVRYGDLLVAQDECAELPDWEVIVFTNGTLDLDMAPYDVHMEVVDPADEAARGEPDGSRQLWGSGLLVRSDGRAHVFRGGGPLQGFSAGELDASGDVGR